MEEPITEEPITGGLITGGLIVTDGILFNVDSALPNTLACIPPSPQFADERVIVGVFIQTGSGAFVCETIKPGNGTMQ